MTPLKIQKSKASKALVFPLEQDIRRQPVPFSAFNPKCPGFTSPGQGVDTSRQCLLSAPFLTYHFYEDLVFNQENRKYAESNKTQNRAGPVNSRIKT